MNIFKCDRICIESSLVKFPVQLSAVLELLAALAHLVGNVTILLEFVSSALNDCLCDGGWWDDAKNVACVNQLYKTLKEFCPNVHVLGLELEVVRWSAGSLLMLKNTIKIHLWKRVLPYNYKGGKGLLILLRSFIFN